MAVTSSARQHQHQRWWWQLEGTRSRRIRKPEMVIVTFALMLSLTHIFTATVSALYIPKGGGYALPPSLYNSMQRRQDSGDDDDDMDSTASAPYQNQEGSNGGGASDGYEENEPDGPYGETPREEEGQADMERFFDDHLGASERDGMDKENLPSELVRHYMAAADSAATRLSNSGGGGGGGVGDGPATETEPAEEPRLGSMVEATNSHHGGWQPEMAATTMAAPPLSLSHDGMPSPSKQRAKILPNVETRYIELPNKKLIIRRQITSDVGIDLSRVPSITQLYQSSTNNSDEINIGQPQKDRLDTNASEIVVTENDDMDPVYVTNATNKPFRIDALGGYDPEEDFREAFRDIEDVPNSSSTSTAAPRRSKSDGRGRDGRASATVNSAERETQLKDITFNDPEADTLFNDASETDEVTFAQDDPYQTDLEAEMRGQAYDQPGSVSSGGSGTAEASSRIPDGRPVARRRSDDDDSEGSWINDGVEDMEIPSQSYQESVLDKAARQEALARRNADDDTDDDNGARQQESEQPEEYDENRRMPDADYLRDHEKISDERDENLRR